MSHLHALGVEQEWLINPNFNPNFPPPLAQYVAIDWSKMVFASMLDGANNATVAIDESPLHAPITFHNGAKISTLEATTLYTPGALFCANTNDYISTPHNPAYDTLGDKDFTIEAWVWSRETPGPSHPMQIAGVWDETNPANQVW